MMTPYESVMHLDGLHDAPVEVREDGTIVLNSWVTDPDEVNCPDCQRRWVTVVYQQGWRSTIYHHTERQTDMEMTDLQTRMLVQTPKNEVLKVSTIYPPTETGTGYVTAEVVYPIPARTAVRSVMPDEVAKWREPSDAIIAKYEIAWGLR